jgi:hypothetical protein
VSTASRAASSELIVKVCQANSSNENNRCKRSRSRHSRMMHDAARRDMSEFGEIVHFLVGNRRELHMRYWINTVIRFGSERQKEDKFVGYLLRWEGKWRILGTTDSLRWLEITTTTQASVPLLLRTKMRMTPLPDPLHNLAEFRGYRRYRSVLFWFVLTREAKERSGGSNHELFHSNQFALQRSSDFRCGGGRYRCSFAMFVQ